MPTSIAALTPATQPFRTNPADRAAPDVPDMEFRELWQDKKEGLSFGDVLDIINPLQHIPVVSNIYRMITGDEIGVGSRLAGGALFGGPLGLLGAGIAAAFESISGDTIENQVASAWKGIAGDEAPQLAQSQPGARRAAALTPGEAAVAAVAGAIDNDVSVEPLPEVSVTQLAAATPVTAAATPLSHQIPVVHRSRIYIPGPERNIPPGIPAPAAQQDGKTAPPPNAEALAERRRIAQAIEQAQRAQAGMLLASVAAEPSTGKPDDDSKENQSTASQPQPFRPHPYMLPPGAPPEMVNKAMAQALDRYEAILKHRGATATPAAPRAVVAPVQ